MARFSISIENPYGEKDYESIKKTYDWIMYTMNDYGKAKVSVSFLFDIGDITCSVDSIEEFTDNAYGMADFHYNNGNITFTFESGEMLFIHINNNVLTISSSNKSLISEIEESLLNKQKQNPSNINHQYNFYGDKNNVAVAGDKGTATVISNGSNNNVNSSVSQSSNKQSGFIDFLKGVGTNIASNIIWILLGALGASVLGIIVYYVQRLFNS